MEAQIRMAIAEAINKFAELTFSQELSNNNHYLKVEFSPRTVSLWLFNSKVECVFNCYLTHLSDSGLSNKDYELETDRLIEKIKAKSKDIAEVLSTLNTEENA